MSVRKALDRGGGGQHNVLEKKSNTIRYDIYIFFKILFFQLSIKRGHVRQNRENQQDKYYSGQMIGSHSTTCWKTYGGEDIIS